VPIVLILPALWGQSGILYAQPIADIVSAALTVFMATRLRRELDQKEMPAFAADQGRRNSL
jgi:hypothetical protein